MRNGFERALGAQLKAAKCPHGYETLKLPYVRHHVYNPDFILDNGIIIEAKGRFMNDDAAKMIAVKKQYPDLDIRFVFVNAHQKIGGQKNTYAQWADRNGFPWADKRIPEEWIR